MAGKQNVVCGFAEELRELQEKEKQMQVQPDWEIDAFTKAQIQSGKRNSIVTDLILKLLDLEVSSCCAFNAPYWPCSTQKAHQHCIAADNRAFAQQIKQSGTH